MWDGFNKRKFPRVNVRCDLRLSREPGADSISTVTENLGAGGVCVVLDHEMRRFDHCQLELELREGEKRIKCAGKIMWSVRSKNIRTKKNNYDTGIEFKDLDGVSTTRVKKFLEEIISI